jgi:hypothetical protein
MTEAGIGTLCGVHINQTVTYVLRVEVALLVLGVQKCVDR